MTASFTRTHTVPRPAICRMVHYVQRGSADGRYLPRCAAAVVVDVPGGSAGSAEVNVTVFGAEGGLFPQLRVCHAPAGEGKEPGTWHWHTECPDEPAE